MAKNKEQLVKEEETLKVMKCKKADESKDLKQKAAMIEKDKKPTKATSKSKKKSDDDEEPIIIIDEDEEIESLETIKKRIVKTFKERGFIDMSEVLDQTSHLDLSDEDVDSLIAFLKSKGVDVISDIDAEAELDDIDGEVISKELA